MGNQTIDLGCCGDTQPTNPKKDLWSRRGAQRSMSLFDIRNPLQVEVEDTKELGDFFKNWPFIPYAGTTLQSSHALLDLFIMLRKLSPTHGTCIGKKTEYAVGGRVKIVNAINPVWSLPTENIPVPIAAQTTYAQNVDTYIKFEGGLQKAHRSISDFYQSVGEVYVELSYSTVNGQTRVNITVHKERHVLPAKTETAYSIYGISKIWDSEYLKKNPPRLVTGYPEFTADENGVNRTMFFLKSGELDYHGRPESENGFIYAYREVQDSIYLTKQAAGNFSGQLIIEVEGGQESDAIDNEGAQGAGFIDFANQFENNFSMKADKPQSVLITERPYGAGEMFVFQVKPNTAERWYDVTGEIAIGHITRAHHVTPRFIGKESSNGFSENAYLMDYLTNVEPTINSLRETVTALTNTILNAAWDILNMPDMKQYSITFDNPIQGMLDAFKMQQTGESSTKDSNNDNDEEEDDNGVSGTDK